MSLLRIESLSKSYAVPGSARRMIVDIPELRLNSGEELALCGASGCGKSTFLNLVAGITEPDSGTVRLDGRDLFAMRPADRDRLRGGWIGCIFQSFNLLQGFTAIENVELAMMFGRGVDRAFARDLLNRVGLAEHCNHLPSTLSIGQQQRVAVARALANRPRLILADEPTGNLDHDNARGAMELIRSLAAASGAALIVVSHDRGLLSTFRRVEDFERLNRACQSVSRAGGDS
ncbi:MAG: ABC transporter ATP-binding protein [Phycisphaerae bacterium]|nr:ABC transporter ATP-binding protein [Phycisphaerae bacterium]